MEIRITTAYFSGAIQCPEMPSEQLCIPMYLEGTVKGVIEQKASFLGRLSNSVASLEGGLCVVVASARS